MTNQCAQPPDGDGPKLFDEDSSRSLIDLDLGAKRRRPSAPRCWCNHDHRSREEIVGLHHDTKSVTGLLMAEAPWKSEFVDVTAEHAAPP